MYIYIYIHVTRFDPPPLEKITLLLSLARVLVRILVLTAAPEVSGSILEVSWKSCC